MAEQLSNTDIEQLRALRHRGYAVVVFTPEELRGASVNRVQDRLIELGWDVIDALADTPADDTDTTGEG